MPDPLKPISEWQEAQHKSFEELKAEADERKSQRENLQPLRVGKVNYGSIFKLGDRTRPEMALSLSDKRADTIGSGQVELKDLIPERAFRDLESALAQANVVAQQETQEGIREVVKYDADESEVLRWQSPVVSYPSPSRLVIHPPADERHSNEAESAAFEVDDETNRS